VTVDTVTLFFALLAVACQVGLLASAVVPAWRDVLRPYAGVGALAVAVVCTSGSLYLSEVAHFRPCHLCWVQRGFMYPLVAVLAVVAWRRVPWLRTAAIVAALAGAAVSTYHVLLERFPSLETDVCDPSNPCTLIWVERLGYVTIPVMALTGFLSIAALLTLDRGAPVAAPHPHR
jgi:disulfide bond formation protein DsbB